MQNTGTGPNFGDGATECLDTRNSSEIAGNQQNLLCFARSSLVELKTTLEMLKTWKTNSMGDHLNWTWFR